ncbi:NAD(+)/NADH kinase [Actinospica robiniae]|uniref:NAD(+)/NADH kinase n=1 Tax=Actinospica robiniae TaxID=304901 RepID=UPI00042090B6|nr:NAD(+)/NADH kinase [Actinospica robiniae]
MSLVPRVVVVHRRTEREQIVRERGTWGQAKFQAKAASLSLSAVEERHSATDRALQTVSSAVPGTWRRGAVEREDLDRFLFEPEDIVVVVGQDGLAANVAKYLSGQPVIGIDPSPGTGLGVLTRHRPDHCAALIAEAAEGRAEIEERTMVAAAVSSTAPQAAAAQTAAYSGGGGPGYGTSASADGGSSAALLSPPSPPAPPVQDGSLLTLHALNEVYLGSPTHQSARYVLTLPDGRSEQQSSSGLLAGTGTGATGWLRSAARERHSALTLPAPTERRLGWFVREAWPSPATGADLTEGLIEPAQALRVLVQSEDLVVFGDGIEADRLTLSWGQTVTITPAAQTLRLVV